MSDVRRMDILCPVCHTVCDPVTSWSSLRVSADGTVQYQRWCPACHLPFVHRANPRPPVVSCGGWLASERQE